MNIFHKKIRFSEIDPLANGLDQDIAAEQREPEAIILEENLEATVLSANWQEMVDEAKADPDWFAFVEEE